MRRAAFHPDESDRLKYNNGDEGVVDLADFFWSLMFEPLRNPPVFRRFEVSDVLHPIKWEDNADLTPEYLHRKMREQSNSPETNSRIIKFLERKV
ncbi:MAG: DUF2442 domain-containing protein [Planctomycetota bacterium]